MLTPWSETALLAISSFAFYAFAVIAYRLTFHPLAKYPGPFLAKITSWYDVYHCYLKDRHLDQLRCQQQYGDVFRYGPDYLVIQTTGGLRDIYANAKTNRVKKGKQYRMLHQDGAVSTHSAIDKDIHAFMRRVMSYAFSEHALRSLEPLMVESIELWLKVLNEGTSAETKGWSSPKNMADYANYVTFDVLGELCFGQRFGLLDSDELKYILPVILSRTEVLHIIGHAPIRACYKFMIDTFPALERLFFPKAYSSPQEFRVFAGKALKNRAILGQEQAKNGEEPRKDFVHFLTQAKDPETGAGYDQYQMLSELRLLIIAGSDTSAVVMAAAFFYLVRYPRVLRKLQNEMRAAFSKAEDIITGPELSSCVYLRAVIEESLRMSPPVTSSLQREVESPGMTIDGMALPAGVTVGTGAYGMHYNPDYFKNPYTFSPERWLSEYTPKEEMELAKMAFCPFSMGYRGCIGKPMAYNELSIAMGRVCWTYDMRLKAGDKTGQAHDGTYQLRDIFVSERDGPLIEFKKHDKM